MRSADRRRLMIVLAISGIAHLGVLALLALNRPESIAVATPPIFQVEVVPFVMPTRREEAAPAQSLASRSRELAAEARDRAREKAQGYVDATGRHVAEKPVQSLLLGVAAGALIGTLLASRRRR